MTAVIVSQGVQWHFGPTLCSEDALHSGQRECSIPDGLLQGRRNILAWIRRHQRQHTHGLVLPVAATGEQALQKLRYRLGRIRQTAPSVVVVALGNHEAARDLGKDCADR